MKVTLHFKSAIIAWVGGPIRYLALARVFVLVPPLFACFAVDASDGVPNFSNTALLRPAPTIITFDVPGAGTGPGEGTQAIHINPAGAVTGYYLDSGDVFHGYVRANDGTFATFDAPGAGTDPGQGTLPASNNPAETITGFYIDANDVSHGFLRTP